MSLVVKLYLEPYASNTAWDFISFLKQNSGVNLLSCNWGFSHFHWQFWLKSDFIKIANSYKIFFLASFFLFLIFFPSVIVFKTLTDFVTDKCLNYMKSVPLSGAFHFNIHPISGSWGHLYVKWKSYTALFFKPQKSKNLLQNSSSYYYLFPFPTKMSGFSPTSMGSEVCLVLKCVADRIYLRSHSSNK